MKKYIFIMFLVFMLPGFAWAQGFGLGPSLSLSFDTDLNPSSTSNLVLRAGVGFYDELEYATNQISLNPSDPPVTILLPVPTNALTIAIETYAPASDVLVWRQESNGTPTLISVITNENIVYPGPPTILNIVPGFGGSMPYYLYSQSVTPSAAKIQDLLNGEWYLEIDFDDTNFVGECLHDYGQIEPPQAAVPPLNTPLSSPGLEFGIATNNQYATIVLNGSTSTDPYYLPLQFSWSEGSQFLGSTPVLTNNFTLGSHTVTLTVTDGLGTNSLEVPLQIITPGDEARNIILTIEQEGWPSKQNHGLIQPLKDAAMFFDRGRFSDGVRALKKLTDTSYLRLLKLNDLDIGFFAQFIDSFIQAIEPSQSPD